MPRPKALDIQRLQIEIAIAERKKNCLHIKNGCKPGTFHLTSPETIKKLQCIQDVFSNPKYKEM